MQDKLVNLPKEELDAIIRDVLWSVSEIRKIDEKH